MTTSTDSTSSSRGGPNGGRPGTTPPVAVICNAPLLLALQLANFCPPQLAQHHTTSPSGNDVLLSTTTSLRCRCSRFGAPNIDLAILSMPISGRNVEPMTSCHRMLSAMTRGAIASARLAGGKSPVAVNSAFRRSDNRDVIGSRAKRMTVTGDISLLSDVVRPKKSTEFGDNGECRGLIRPPSTARLFTAPVRAGSRSCAGRR